MIKKIYDRNDISEELKDYENAVQAHIKAKQNESASKLEVSRTRSQVRIAREALRSKEQEIMEEYDRTELTIVSGVCATCKGTKKVSVDGIDKDGNIESGVNEVPCPDCSK